MSREDFIKRFKPGTEAHKVLVQMGIAKEKMVQEKIRNAAGFNMQNSSPEAKQITKDANPGPTLKETAGLNPSQPDYYDIRNSMKKIIDKVYQNDVVLSRQASPSNTERRKHLLEKIRHNSQFETTSRNLENSDVKTFTKTMTAWGTGAKHRLPSMNIQEMPSQPAIATLQQNRAQSIEDSEPLQVHITQVGGESIRIGSNQKSSFKVQRDPLKPYKIQMNMTEQYDQSTQPTNREPINLASAALRDSGQQMSDWLSSRHQHVAIQDMRKHSSTGVHVDNLQPLVSVRRVSFAGVKNRDLLAVNPYEQTATERHSKNLGEIEEQRSRGTEREQSTGQSQWKSKSRPIESGPYGFPQVAQKTWRGFDQRDFIGVILGQHKPLVNLLLPREDVQISRRRRVSSITDPASRNRHIYQGVACTFTNRHLPQRNTALSHQRQSLLK